ncbi:hypothetical protein JZU51_00885, partial [bacterium]|nr:hypothetical protein [bacterium]
MKKEAAYYLGEEIKKEGYRLFAQANEQDNLYPVDYGCASITALFYQIAVNILIVKQGVNNETPVPCSISFAGLY